MVVEIIVLAIFLLLGVILYSGKGLIFIAGYNTRYYNMPQIEKNKYDYETFVKSKFMGKIFFAVSFGMVFLILSNIFDLHWLSIAGWVLTVCIIVIVVIYKFKR